MAYTIIENDLLENEDLNIQEQALLIALVRYHNKVKGYAYPNYEQLKKVSRISDTRTLSKNINSLMVKGYLKKETIKGIGCKYYLLKYINTPSGELHQVDNYTTCKDTLPPSGELHHDIVEDYTTTITNTITKKNTNIYTQDFESFYKLYPNPFNKEQSFKNYKAVLKIETKEDILLSVNNYIKYLKDSNTEKKYITRSSNFIGQKQEYKGYLENSKTTQPSIPFEIIRKGCDERVTK